MHKENYIHYPTQKEDLVKRYLIALIPLLIFSFYKNGILLYQNKLISFLDMFIPIYFYIFSIVISFIIAKIFKEDKYEMILYSLIVSLSISINTNMIIYPILLFVGFFIIEYLEKLKGWKLHKTSIMHLLLILALLINAYSYFNIAEKLDIFHYNLFDVFLGFTSGALATTSLFLCIVALTLLSFNRFYKKRIALSCSVTYALIIFIIFLISGESKYLIYLLSGNAYFSFIFIASDLYISPYSEKGMIYYGVLIGVLTSLLTIIIPYEASVLAIFICSLFVPLINKYTNKLYLQK